jgi:hypothetical protein
MSSVIPCDDKSATTRQSFYGIAVVTKGLPFCSATPRVTLLVVPSFSRLREAGEGCVCRTTRILLSQQPGGIEFLIPSDYRSAHSGL